MGGLDGDQGIWDLRSLFWDYPKAILDAGLNAT